jgi:hypothetical protein
VQHCRREVFSPWFSSVPGAAGYSNKVDVIGIDENLAALERERGVVQAINP